MDELSQKRKRFFETLEGNEVPIKEFNYLVKMPMMSMTLEKVEKLEKEVKDKVS